MASLVVRGDRVAAIPVALLKPDVAAERSDKLVARRRRKTAELDRRASLLIALTERLLVAKMPVKPSR